MAARTLLDAYDISAGTTSAISIVGINSKYIGIQAIAISFDDSDATIEVLDSLDGVTFNSISTATTTFDSGTSSVMIRILNFTGVYVKIIINSNSVSTGTITVKMSDKF